MVSITTGRNRDAAVAVILASLTGMALSCASTVYAAPSLTVSMWINDGIQAKGTQALLDQYTKKTGVVIKLVYAPWDAYFDKILSLTAAGKAPDVITLERRHLPRFAANGLVKPLDSLIKTDNFRPKEQLSEYKSCYYKNKFYGFSLWSAPAVLGYDAAMFAKAGVPDPNQLVAQSKWNWDAWLEVGKKLTKDANGDGKPEQFGMGAQGTWQPDWVGLIRQNGGDVIDADYTQAVINSPAAVEALTFWRDLSWRYGICPKPSQGGKSAMWYAWLSLAVENAQTLKKSGVDMQIALRPAGKAGYVTLGGGCPMCISASTKKTAEAYRFAKWFTMESEEWKVVGAPASRKTFEGEYQEWLGKYFTNPEVGRKAIANMGPEPVIHPRFNLLEAAWNPILTRLIQDKVSPRDAAESLAKEINRVLSRK